MTLDHVTEWAPTRGRDDTPRIVDDLLLLTPGPACTSERVRSALARGDLSHREPEFTTVLQSLRDRLPAALGLPDHEAVIVSASGTAVDEMAVIGSVREGRSMLVVSNGVYGERLVEIARRHGIPTVVVTPPGDTVTRWRTPVDPEAVRDALSRHPEVDAVACVLHETTTGLLNPVAQIATYAREAGVVLVLDAISATGIEAPDLATASADFVLGTANKGLHGLPGVAFMLCSARALERLDEVEPRSLYLDARTHLTAQRRGEVAFTPAVQVCVAFDEAVREYLDEGGYAARSALYRRRGEIARAGFRALGLEPLVAAPYRSSSVTTLRLPDGVTYPRLHDALKDRGYVMYAGQGQLARTHFRVCTFGSFAEERLVALEAALGDAIQDAQRTAAATR